VRVRAATALSALPDERIPDNQRAVFLAALAETVASFHARPDDMASHYNLGNFLMARSRLPEAIAEFETTLRLQPDALPAHVNLAMAYNAAGQNEKAEASLRQALRLDPTNAIVHLNLGMLLAEMGKSADAEHAFRAAFRSDPHSARAAYNLGVLLSSDRPQEGLAWSARAVAIEPENPRYGYTYAFYLHQVGQDNQAAAVIRRVRERFPDDESSARLERELFLKR